MSGYVYLTIIAVGLAGIIGSAWWALYATKPADEYDQTCAVTGCEEPVRLTVAYGTDDETCLCAHHAHAHLALLLPEGS